MNYRNALGAGYDFEVTLPSGLRPDAVDWKSRVVRELKSDANSSQATGRRQLQKYVAELEDVTVRVGLAISIRIRGSADG
nr:hypothetical protein [Streptomyces kasugaensis]